MLLFAAVPVLTPVPLALAAEERGSLFTAGAKVGAEAGGGGVSAQPRIGRQVRVRAVEIESLRTANSRKNTIEVRENIQRPRLNKRRN